MTTTETRRYEMLLRVKEFGDNNSQLFPAGSPAADALAIVTSVTSALAEHATAKAATKKGRGRKREARLALVAHLEAMSRSARQMAAEMQEFEDAFQLPTARNDQAYLASARAFLREAAPLKDRFVSFGMPESFLTTLGELTDRLENAISRRQAGLNDESAARAGIATTLAAGMMAARKLDVILRNRLADDAVVLARWEQARRIDWARRARRTPAIAAVPAGEPLGSESPLDPTLESSADLKKGAA